MDTKTESIKEVYTGIQSVSFAYSLFLKMIPTVRKLSYTEQSELLNLEFDNIKSTPRQIEMLNDSNLETNVRDLLLSLKDYYPLIETIEYDNL